MTDDAVCTSAIKRYGSVELSKQVSVMRSDVLSPDATALLALAEDVVALDVSVHHVHEQGNACTIVSTESSPVCVPHSIGLAYLISPDLTMHCVNVSDEQGTATCYAVVDVKITCTIHGCERLEFCG
jgi:hypothetical protein